MLPFRYGGKIRAFPDKQKLREFTVTGPDLQDMLKGSLQAEMKRESTQNSD